MTNLLTTESLLALLTLTAMEIVLGIDNIIFIAILVGRLPKSQQKKARQLGLGAALGTRLLLLLSLTWIMRLTRPLFEVGSHPISGRDLILLIGGAFLIFKATHEIHGKLEGEGDGGLGDKPARTAKFSTTIAQIAVLDIVFSLDSVITAVGMAQAIEIMIIAVIAAVAVMLVASGSISQFVEKHPTVKILALSFLILIGVSLLVEGMGGHVDKGYIYFAMFFSFAVELVNMRARRKAKPVVLHEPKL